MKESYRKEGHCPNDIRKSITVEQLSSVPEIYPAGFPEDSNGDRIGDLNGIREKNSYLKKILASGFIWINLIYPSPFIDNG